MADGLHAVSLRRVAAALGVTAPALYAHVADKRDLLQIIAQDELAAILRAFDAIDIADPVDCIRGQCHAYLDHACRNPDLFRAMFVYRPELTAEATGETEPLVTRLLERMAEPVRAAQRSGRFADELDAELATLTVWTAVHGAAVVLLSGPPLHIDLRAGLVDSVVESVMAGLSRPVGAGVS